MKREAVCYGYDVMVDAIELVSLHQVICQKHHLQQGGKTATNKRKNIVKLRNKETLYS